MKLVDTPKTISIKKQLDGPRLSGKDLEKYLKENAGLVEIVPTRLENIQVFLFYPADKIPPKRVTIYYYDAAFGAHSGQDLTLEFLEQKTSKDGKVKRVKIPNTGNWTMPDILKVKNIYFESLDLDEFEVGVDVHLKYTYQIHAGRFQEEFSLEDGKCHHTPGDRYTYNEDIELCIMEVDHDLGIVYCSAIGFLR